MGCVREISRRHRRSRHDSAEAEHEPARATSSAVPDLPLLGGGGGGGGGFLVGNEVMRALHSSLKGIQGPNSLIPD